MPTGIVVILIVSSLMISAFACSDTKTGSVDIVNTTVPPASIATATVAPPTPMATVTKSTGEEPALNILDAIGNEEISVIRQHVDLGINFDEHFIPEGFPLAGASALHLAALVGNEEIIQLLLDNEATIDIKAKDESEGTPLQWAAFFAKTETTKLLVNDGADVNAIDKNGCTPLCAALLYNAFVEQDIIFQENRAKIQAFLKSEGGNAGNTPVNDFNIFEAIGNEDILLVNKYLKEPINLEALFIPEGFPFAGASTLHLAIIVGNEEIVKSLLENGTPIDIKAKDQPAGTPLHWAAFFAKKEMTKLLVNAKADINAKDNNGCTPLCAAFVPNPFAEDDDDKFNEDRLEIQAFLMGKGGK